MNENTKAFYDTIRNMPEEKKVKLWNKHLTGRIINYGEVLVEDRLRCSECVFYDLEQSIEQKGIHCSLKSKKIKNDKCKSRILTHEDNFKALALTILLGMAAMIIGTVVLTIVVS